MAEKFKMIAVTPEIHNKFKEVIASELLSRLSNSNDAIAFTLKQSASCKYGITSSKMVGILIDTYNRYKSKRIYKEIGLLTANEKENSRPNNSRQR